MNLPNALTVLRIVLIPVFVWAYYRISYPVALAIYVIASLTDYLDGYLARKWNQITAFGKLMDPLADKLMTLTVLFCLAQSGYAPWWLVGIMIAKEALMVLGSLFMLGKNVVVSANYFGKTATVLFIIAIVFVFPWHSVAVLHTIGTVLLYVALASSVLALVMYARDMVKQRF